MKTSVHKPVCHVVAGPNGSGKSTFALRYLPDFAGSVEYVNPDLMAQGMSPTDIRLSWYIWPVIVLSVACHASQARKADYYRGLHLYFLKGTNDNFFARSKDLHKELAALPEGTSPFRRLYLKIYLLYTAVQEKGAKHSQQLLDKIDENGGIPEGLAARYTDQSRKIIQITNVLGFNLRTYTLFLLLLLQREVFWFLFVCIVLEGLKYAMMARYETVAGRISAEFFPEDAERSGRRKGGNGR